MYETDHSDVSSSTHFLRRHFLGNLFLPASSHQLAGNRIEVAKCGRHHADIVRVPEEFWATMQAVCCRNVHRLYRSVLHPVGIIVNTH